MGITKSYQLFLFLFFIGASSAAYYFELDKLKFEASAQNDALIQHLESIDSDGTEIDPGKELHESLSHSFVFKFFQYANNQDGRLNITEGSLSPEDTTPWTKLFSVQIRHVEKRPNAQLLIILNIDSQINYAINELKLFLIFFFLAYLLLATMFWLLAKSHRKAIYYATEYIKNIPSLAFTAIESSKLNGEFKPIASALIDCRNELKHKLDILTKENDKLTQLAFKDPVTGFGSRQRFTQKLDAISKQTKAQIGLLVNVKVTELAQINQLHGKNAGDDYLVNVVSCIRKTLLQYHDADCYRVSSSDFAIFIPDIPIKESQDFAELLKTQFDEYQTQLKADSIAYIGIIPFEAGSDPVQLLSLSETAISIALTLGPNSYHILEKLDGDTLFGDDRWRVAIDDILKRQAIKFYQQPIQACSKDSKLYNELFSRFYNTDGKFLPTATVIAMAERHGMVAELDKIVVLNVISMLKNSPSLIGSFGINISSSSRIFYCLAKSPLV